MKKVVALILVLASCLVLSSCAPSASTEVSKWAKEIRTSLSFESENEYTSTVKKLRNAANEFKAGDIERGLFLLSEVEEDLSAIHDNEMMIDYFVDEIMDAIK